MLARRVQPQRSGMAQNIDMTGITTPGSYEYFCSLHPHMTGTIVVEAANSAAP